MTDPTPPAVKPGPSPVRLRELVDEITPALNPNMMADKIAALKASDGLRIRDKGPHVEVRLAGVTSTSTAGGINAMANWCAAARRKIAALEG